jgi:hypothetical protein
MSGGWQPIETLPRDGTAVLVVDANGYFDFGYWHKNHVCSDGAGRSEIFTHWMPLPNPPERK